jgi:hypothetical protein
VARALLPDRHHVTGHLDTLIAVLDGNWQQFATVDPARIRRWWIRLPYNIGLACGPSKLIVLDLDLPRQARTSQAVGTIPRDGGTDALAGLCREHGEPFPPATFTVRTPSGGCHLYYAAPATTVRNSAGRLASSLPAASAWSWAAAACRQRHRRQRLARDVFSGFWLSNVPAPHFEGLLAPGRGLPPARRPHGLRRQVLGEGGDDVCGASA